MTSRARMAWPLIAAILQACGTTSTARTGGDRTDVPLSVPVKPVPVRTADGTLVAYELLLGKYGALGLRPSRVDVLAAGGEAALLRSWKGEELDGWLVPPPEGWPDVGLFLVGFTLPPGKAVPATIQHAVTLADGTVATGAPVAVSTSPALVIGPPVRGERWWAANGPTTEPVYHRNARVPAPPHVYFSERFAIDYLQLGADGRPFRGDGKANADWYCHGAELVAVSDGTIVDVRDGVPENLPLAGRAIPMTMQNLGGNYVVLDVGDRHEAFAFYAHAIPGSIGVRIGDRVKAGQVLARLGNSGNSDAPHLHFHVCDGAGPLGKRDESLFCNGLPYVHPSFVLRGSTPADFMEDGKGFTATGAPQVREAELVLRDQVVDLGR